MNNTLTKLHRGLIVSCQALPEEPLHSSFIMGKMALAAKQAGASGIRANSVPDILEIRATVNLPMIGIIKRVFPDSLVYITPTQAEIAALVDTGVEIIATDATNRPRPNGQTLDDFFQEIRAAYPNQLFMADCSSLDDMLHAQELGFDLVGTTLVGYTEKTRGAVIPDFELISQASSTLRIPLIAEGGIHYPPQLRKVLDCGAFCAVVGGAITRPQEITARFLAAIEEN